HGLLATSRAPSARVADAGGLKGIVIVRFLAVSVRKETHVSRKYELVYVISPDVSDDQVNELHSQIEAIVQRMGGQIEKTDNWGRRKLAYEIGRHKEGTYVLEVINGGGELMKEIDRRLKVIDHVIRHLVVRVDEEQEVVERTRAPRHDTTPRPR